MKQWPILSAGLLAITGCSGGDASGETAAAVVKQDKILEFLEEADAEGGRVERRLESPVVDDMRIVREEDGSVQIYSDTIAEVQAGNRKREAEGRVWIEQKKREHFAAENETLRKAAQRSSEEDAEIVAKAEAEYRRQAEQDRAIAREREAQEAAVRKELGY